MRRRCCCRWDRPKNCVKSISARKVNPIMVAGKRIRDFATLWVAMSAIVGLSLWVIVPVLPAIPAPSAAVPDPTPNNFERAQTGRIIELDLKGTIVLYSHANGRAGA